MRSPTARAATTCSASFATTAAGSSGHSPVTAAPSCTASSTSSAPLPPPRPPRAAPRSPPPAPARLEAVSADLAPAWQEVIRERAPNALVCADPFHVIKLAGEALDTLRQDWQRLRKQDPRRAVWLKGTRFVLRQRADTLTAAQRDLIDELAETNERVYRGWLLCDQLRAVYAADGEEAAPLLEQWLHAAASSLLVPFVKLARTLSQHREGIINAIRLRLSNARLEAMNSTIRLISHRSRGFRRLNSLLALIRLICGRIPIELPT